MRVIIRPAAGTALFLLALLSLRLLTPSSSSAQPRLTTTPIPQSVVSFTLIDASNGSEVATINDNYVVNCDQVGTLALTIRANTNPSTVGSVRFALDSNPNYNTENISPYTLASNNGSDYVAWTPPNGQHTLTARPYTQANAGGSAGQALTVVFSAENCDIPPTATPTRTNTSTGSTITPTSTRTATNTPGGATSTATLTATNTPAGATSTATPTNVFELLRNGNFENAGTSNAVPQNWTRINPSRDKRRCNATIAIEGTCVFQFKATSTENSKLKQNVDLSVIAPVQANAGDTLILGGYIKAAPGTRVKIKVRVNYTGTTLAQGKINLSYNAPTDGWQPFTGGVSLPLAGDPAQIKVMLHNRGRTGKVLFDRVSLQLVNDVSP